MAECGITRPNVNDYANRIKAEYSIGFLGGGSVIPGSFEDITAFALSGLMYELFGAVQQSIDQQDITKACCDNLYLLAAQRGIYPRKASLSRGFIVIFGTPGTLIPSNLQFSGNNQLFQLDDIYLANPLKIGANGQAIMRIRSINAGASANIVANGGNELTVTSTNPGINTNVTILNGGLALGGNDETCDEFRSRLLNMQTGNNAIPGSLEWYRNEVMKYPGVTRVCFDTCSNCCTAGSLTIYPFFDNVYQPFGVPPQAATDQMTADIWGVPSGVGYGKAPFGQNGCIGKAHPAFFDLNIIGANLSDLQIQNIKNAIQSVLIKNACPSQVICKDLFLSAILPYLSGNCYRRLQYIMINNMTQDEGVLVPDCSYFPVLRNVING